MCETRSLFYRSDTLDWCEFRNCLKLSLSVILAKLFELPWYFQMRATVKYLFIRGSTCSHWPAYFLDLALSDLFSLCEILHQLFRLEFPLKLLQLPLETVIWINEEPYLLDVVVALGIGHSELLH